MKALDKVDNDLKSKIGKRIKQLREEKTGLSSAAFAKKIDKDKQSQSRWEKEGASIFIINKFCKEINITLMDFFNADIFNSK